MVLEQSLKIGDKLEVNSGRTGAQSFQYGPAPGGPNFQISKLRLYLSKSASAPTANLVVSLGTTLNGGTIANSTVNPFGESANSAQVSASPQARLTGTIIGSSGSWGGGNTIEKVFDGNLGTFYDAVNASGDWAGLDLGVASVVTQIKYCPRSGYAGRMVGGQFQGANVPDFSSGVVTLFIVATAPSEGVLTVRAVSPTAFRYLRYLGPANGFCNVAEVEFWSANSGTPPPAMPDGLAITRSNWTTAVTWNASGGATSYRVKRSTSSGGPYTTITNVSSTSFTDFGLPPNTLYSRTYFYVVSALNANGEGANSAQAEVTMAPTPPTRLTVTADFGHVMRTVCLAESSLSNRQVDMRGLLIERFSSAAHATSS